MLSWSLLSVPDLLVQCTKRAIAYCHIEYLPCESMLAAMPVLFVTAPTW